MDARLIIAVCIGVAMVLVGLVAGLRIWLKKSREREGQFVFNVMAGTLRVYTIWRDDDLVRVMNVQGTMQSATYLQDYRYTELVFDYTKLYNCMFDVGLAVRSVLVLGGGGYSYPKYLISHHADVKVTCVEIDPMITAVAKRYFFVDRLIEEYDLEKTGRLSLVCDDARAFLETDDARYSAIVNDCFSGVYSADRLATFEAAVLFHEHLVENGVYLSNVIGSLEGARSQMLQRIVATLAQVFDHVYVVAGQPDHPANCDNNIVIATDGDWAFEDVFALAPDANAEVLFDANAADGDWMTPKAL
jgi:spermidine synthase